MTGVIVVRHGYSESNITGTYTGHIDAKLSEVGKKQSQLLCEYLHKNYLIDAIYSSDLSRAVETVLPLAEKLGLKINTSEALRELYGGEWEGLEFSRLPELFPEDFKVWQKDLGNSRCTGGESFKEMTDRGMQELKRIAEENLDKLVVVSTHGGLIKGVECVIRGISLERVEEIPYVVNASVTLLKYEDGKFIMVASNLSDFLGDLQTEMPKGI